MECAVWAASLLAFCVASFSHQVSLSTQDQYVFIHDAVLESVTCGDTQIEASSLRVAMRKLKEKSLQGGSPLQQQFSVSLLYKV